jgi:uncharacterized membrane protein YgcG
VFEFLAFSSFFFVFFFFFSFFFSRRCRLRSFSLETSLLPCLCEKHGISGTTLASKITIKTSFLFHWKQAPLHFSVHLRVDFFFFSFFLFQRGSIPWADFVPFVLETIHTYKIQVDRTFKLTLPSLSQKNSNNAMNIIVPQRKQMGNTLKKGGGGSGSGGGSSGSGSGSGGRRAREQLPWRATGMYPDCAWADEDVRRLVVSRRIAPRYKGLQAPPDDAQEGM